MSPVKPLGWLVLVSLLSLLLVSAWWVSLAPADRVSRLTVVRRAEQGTSPPPMRLMEQPQWLVAHRLGRLQGIACLVLVAGLVGVGEGVARRQRDPLGGYRLLWWKGGVLSGALVITTVTGVLIMPSPVPLLVVAWGLAALTGLCGYALTTGRPSLP
jgi:hypothetical protein